MALTAGNGGRIRAADHLPNVHRPAGRRKRQMFVVSVVVAGLWIASPAHGPGVSADLMSQAQEQGHVRIIVKVARDAPAGETIEAAQDAVLNELARTSFKVLPQYINSAFLP